MFSHKTFDTNNKLIVFRYYIGLHPNLCFIVYYSGYMSPEYAMHGQFSVKSDVYSFGVLVLEIISGKRNSEFYETGYAEDLLNYVIT